MAASDSTTTDSTRSIQMTRYQVGELWLALLDQDVFWVPRGAWLDYADASAQRIEGRTRAYAIKANFDVDGAVRVVDMEVSHRRNVANFMWRRTVDICNRLAWGPLYGPRFSGGEEWDCDFDDHDRYLDLARDEAARRTWFEAKPLIVALRGSIVAERAVRFGGPVLLDAPAQLPAPSGRPVLLLDRPSRPALLEVIEPQQKRSAPAIEPAPESSEDDVELDLANDWHLCLAMGWEYLGQSRPTSPPYWRRDDGQSVANTAYDMPDAEDLLRWLGKRFTEVGTELIGSTWMVTAGGFPRGVGDTLRAAARDLVVSVLEADRAAAAAEADEDRYDSCSGCGGYHSVSYDCSADGY